MLGVLLGLLGCAAAPLHTRRWVEVESAHFLILTPRDEAEAIELALVVTTWSHSEKMEAEVQALLDEISVAEEP